MDTKSRDFENSSDLVKLRPVHLSNFAGISIISRILITCTAQLIVAFFLMGVYELLRGQGSHSQGRNWRAVTCSSIKDISFALSKTTSNITRHLKSSAAPLYHSLVTSLEVLLTQWFVEKNFVYQSLPHFSCALQRAGGEPGDKATVDQMRCYCIYTHMLPLANKEKK